MADQPALSGPQDHQDALGQRMGEEAKSGAEQAEWPHVDGVSSLLLKTDTEIETNSPWKKDTLV